MNEPATKALVVFQPWATLIALGVKTIETRPSPPNGPMCPAGVRGYPGLRLEPGERLAIVAGAAQPPGRDHLRRFGPYSLFTTYYTDGLPELRRPPCLTPDGNAVEPAAYEDGRCHRLPLGAVVCTVTVDDACPMGGPTTFRTGIVEGDEGDLPGHDVLVVHDWPGRPGMEARTLVLDRAHGPTEDISAQLPFGLYEPGRAGWLLADPAPCDPIPCGRAQGVRNSQGVFRLPPEIAAMIPNNQPSRKDTP